MLKDGARIWDWMVGLAPPERRADVRAMGERAWGALGGFVRGQTLVALFDAVLIGLALVVIGVPLVLPLAVLTFFGAYVPVVGAAVTAMLAVLVALVANGFAAAVAVLAAILASSSWRATCCIRSWSAVPCTRTPSRSCSASPPAACSPGSSAPCWPRRSSRSPPRFSATCASASDAAESPADGLVVPHDKAA